MKLKLWLAAAVCCAVFSGCTPLESNVENLMMPPKLTELQSEVDSALRDAVGRDFILKYPGSGEYRSGYNFMDIDGDKSDEAVAFISTGEDALQIALLRQDAGRWFVSDLVPGQAFFTEVDFVSVQTIGSLPRLIVGWSSTGRDNKLMALYNYSQASGAQSSLSIDSRWDYSQVMIADFDMNGGNELLLLVASDSYEGTVPNAQLIGENKNGLVDLLASTPLARNIVSFYPPVCGIVSDALYGAAADCMLSNGNMCTITIVYNGSNLLLPLNEEVSDQSLFKQTIRTQKVLSCDINSDGTVDIPVERLADGHRAGSADAAYFVDYSNLRGGALEKVQSAYVNLARGYRLLLPKAWEEHPVSVLVQPDNREAVFFINSGNNLYDHSKELLRIQVRSTLDGQDKLAQERYFQLGARGAYLYSAALPISPIDGLTMTRKQVEKAFSLI